jgi:hypothetical protein
MDFNPFTVLSNSREYARNKGKMFNRGQGRIY